MICVGDRVVIRDVVGVFTVQELIDDRSTPGGQIMVRISDPAHKVGLLVQAGELLSYPESGPAELGKHPMKDVRSSMWASLIQERPDPNHPEEQT